MSAPGRGGTPGTSLLFDVFALNQAVGRLLGAALADSRLGPAAYAVYSAIFELEAATPTAVAERLGMPLTTLVDRLREIEARGDASRIPNRTDRRSHLVVLTASGLAAHAAAGRQFEIANRAVLAALASTELEAQAALRHVRAAVERAAIERAPISPRPLAGRAR